MLVSKMDEDDDIDVKTILNRPASGAMTIVDLLADAPAEQMPFEVTFDRRTVDVHSREPQHKQPILEVWTANRVYMISQSLTCFEVLDRETTLSDRTHKFLGARLIGGQRKYGKTLHTTKPFPVAGTEAVFTRPQANGQPGPIHVTSRVERVVLHVSVTTLMFDEDDAFGDVTNAWLLPKR
jgi:hypothetical protein